jgi:hypothetical protein
LNKTRIVFLEFFLRDKTWPEQKGRVLDGLRQPSRLDGKRFAHFQPFSSGDCQVFAAVLIGEHALRGFRNRNLQARLYDQPAAHAQSARRRSQQVSRQIAKLRGYGLIKKVPGCRLYRATEHGTRLMAAALHCGKSSLRPF